MEAVSALNAVSLFLCNFLSAFKHLSTEISMLYNFSLLMLLLSLIQSPGPSFEAQTIDSNISIGYGLALGDVDGDGRPDILLADQKQFVWYRNGDWKRFVMVENLTAHDNVCIAARDLDGDGKVEVAVGAQWNPSETSNSEASGSVHYLLRPHDPTQSWKAVKLYHEPTIHRMRWVRSAAGSYYLSVLPLHGRGNKDGAGEGVRMLVYRYPDFLSLPTSPDTIATGMHLTHNFTVDESHDTRKAGLYVAGKEGIRLFQPGLSKGQPAYPAEMPVIEGSAGEVRMGKLTPQKNFIATIEPMHGRQVVIYIKENTTQRMVIDENVLEGHAVATADFLGTGRDQVVAGWRVPNKEGKVGIRLYSSHDVAGKQWTAEWVDENGMACEDIQVMDMNGDGRPDIVASGRGTHNLKIYWNRSGKK